MIFQRVNGTDYACPFLDKVRPHTAAEYEDLESDILRRQKIIEPLDAYMSARWGRCLIDGMTRARIGEAHQLLVPVRFHDVSDQEAEDLARALNFARRHMTAEEQQKWRDERIGKAVEARKNRQTIRQIASDLGVSPEQIRRDLAEAKRREEAQDQSRPSRVEIAAGAEPEAPGRSTMRVRIELKAFASCSTLSKTVAKLLAASVEKRARLRALAESYGVPLAEDGKSWPVLEKVAAVLRDLNPGTTA